MPASRRPYRVLAIAEAANPEWTSVPLIGWSLSRALAKIADVHLVTQVRNRDAIIRAGLVEGRDFSVIDNEYLASPLHKMAQRLKGGAGKGWTTVTAVSSLAYYSFEHEVWRTFRKRLRAREFDLVHRITPLSPTSQSLIARKLARLGVPFILGPLNGGVPWPKHFVERKHAEKEWLSYVRGLYRLMPGYRSTHKFASAVIAGSRHTYGELPEWSKDKRVYIPENGVDIERFSEPRERRASGPIRAAFLGRLVPYKGADMLLEAAAEFLHRGELELHIIGDGPEEERLRKMTGELGIRRNVIFHGWVPHTEVQAKLGECDILVLPSVREFGGGVVVESMALGVAPIVADYAGPSELVDEKTGIKVSFTDKQSLVSGLRDVLREVLRNPELLDSMGAAGRDKVLKKLTWDAKARQVLAVYDAVIRRAGDLSFLDYH